MSDIVIDPVGENAQVMRAIRAQDFARHCESWGLPEYFGDRRTKLVVVTDMEVKADGAMECVMRGGEAVVMPLSEYERFMDITNYEPAPPSLVLVVKRILG